jgi:hypothetical protein
MTYRKSKINRRKANRRKTNRRKTNKRQLKKTKKMRGGQDDKPQPGSLRLYKDENPQF